MALQGHRERTRTVDVALRGAVLAVMSDPQPAAPWGAGGLQNKQRHRGAHLHPAWLPPALMTYTFTLCLSHPHTHTCAHTHTCILKQRR